MYKYKIVDEESLPIYGYKIHISATLDNYKDIYNLLSPLLDDRKISYKYIYREEDVAYNFSIRESPANSGKYFTIYPKNNDAFRSILELLYQTIPKNMEGIYILSDRAYKDSNTIFYRYGFFREDLEYLEKGIPTLLGPNGEKWQDYQKAYFNLPEWIQDIQENTFIKDSYLARNYRLKTVLTQSNGGNVYQVDSVIEGKKYILKECRPHIISFGGVETQALRKNEYEISKKLLDCVPAVRETVTEWINQYYIYEFIDGSDLLKYTKPYSIVSYKKPNKELNIKRFKSFLLITRELLELIEYFHSRNIILNDIHPGNFIKSKNKLYFVDLENSYEYDNKPAIGLYSVISLKEWNSIDGKVSDCHKVGNLLLFLLARLHVKSMDDLSQSYHILNSLLAEFGLKTNFTSIIEKLFSKDATVSDILKDLNEIYVYQIESLNSLDEFLTGKPERSFTITEIINKELVNFQRYENAKNNQLLLQHLMHREKNLGLDGLSGLLILMKIYDFDCDVIDYGINIIIEKLIATDNGRMVPIESNLVSPYLNNGTAGFIRALIFIDFEKYTDLIKELSEGLITEFAQYADFWNGMLGIADTLLELYFYFRVRKYKEVAWSLLNTVECYVKYSKADKQEYLYVLSKYMEMKEN